jgi:DNA-binding transcriptional LysR family regulator
MDKREVFITVVEENGFSSAAAKLETTPAAVSRKIKSLEEYLGVRLLQRTTRSLKLTPEGETYYREAKLLLGQLNFLEQDLAARAGQLSGDLKIAAPMSYGQTKIAPLISAFVEQHPRLRVSLMLEDKECNIIDEGYDLAIRISYPEDTSLVGRKIAELENYFCASPGYLKKNGTPETPADLANHHCLHYNLISERDEWTFMNGSKEEVIPISSRFCSNNGDVLVQAAIDGLGITVMPEFIVERALENGQLIRVLKGMERPSLSLYLLYPSRNHIPAKTRTMIDYLIKHLSES